MAITHKKTKGKTGPVINYTSGNQELMRAKPAHVGQTQATKERSRNFGLASAAGRILRAQLEQAILVPRDRSTQIRFCGAIAKWMQRNVVAEIPSAIELPFIHDFTFSKKKGMDVRCRVPMLVEQVSDDLMTIALPAFIPTRDISAPAGTVEVKFTLAMAGCNLAKSTYTGSETIEMHLDYNHETIAEQTLSFEVPVLPGSLLVTVGSMKYIMNGGSVCRKEDFMPCSVIDARYVK